MAVYLETFGTATCEIHIKEQSHAGEADRRYRGDAYVWEDGGLALRQVGDPAGLQVVVEKASEHEVYTALRNYLIARFGPQGEAPAREILQPPLRDDR